MKARESGEAPAGRSAARHSSRMQSGTLRLYLRPWASRQASIGQARPRRQGRRPAPPGVPAAGDAGLALFTLTAYVPRVTMLSSTQRSQEVGKMRRTKLLLLLAIVMLAGRGRTASPPWAWTSSLKAAGAWPWAPPTTRTNPASCATRWTPACRWTCISWSCGQLSLGLSGGAGYANLHYHGVWDNFPNPVTPARHHHPDLRLRPTTTCCSRLRWSASCAVGSGHSLTVRAGGFAGYFLSGTIRPDLRS